MNKNEKYFLNFSLSLDLVALSLRKLRSGRITQYIWLTPAVVRPIFASVSLRQTSDILNVIRNSKNIFLTTYYYGQF